MAWMLYVLTVAFTCVGQIMQKLAARRWQLQGGGAVVLLMQSTFWVAVVCLVSAAGCWLMLLQRWQVGRAYALLSVNYIVMMILARLLFHERLHARHWIGSALIVAGVALMSAGQ
jgi:undecaprenyl phosphate-alpha-L-ara4N flippase subunit ArnE